MLFVFRTPVIQLIVYTSSESLPTTPVAPTASESTSKSQAICTNPSELNYKTIEDISFVITAFSADGKKSFNAKEALMYSPSGRLTMSCNREEQYSILVRVHDNCLGPEIAYIRFKLSGAYKFMVRIGKIIIQDIVRILL